jgi:hypothetical protein
LTKAGHYEATWIPGLDHEIDVDASPAVSFRWLAEAERTHGGRGIVVMYAKQR